jgi:hypothetical protein
MCLEGAKEYGDIIATSSIEFRGLGQRKIVKSIDNGRVVEVYPDGGPSTVTHSLRCLPVNADPKLLKF